MNYIQEAIRQIKSTDLAEMKKLHTKGHRKIRFTLEKLIPKGKKKSATASVPILWIIEAKERYEISGKKDEKAFSAFISDWISGWV